jgi:hypothetical protein
MAVSHTPFPENVPGFYGEYKLGKFLGGVPDDELQLWFGVNYLAGVGETDVLLGHPRLGLVVVEVKGHNRDQILSYSRQNIEYANNQHGHPAKQARLNAQRLGTWFKDQRSVFGPNPPKAPWVHSLAWWPNMYRAEWEQLFSGPGMEFAVEDGKKMLFAEEMEGGEDLFFQAVDAIRRDPLLAGAPPPHAALSDTTGFQAFVGLINAQGQIIRPIPIGTKLPPTIIPTVIEEIVFETVTPEPAPAADPTSTVQVVFTGAPGTGKTLQLVKEGIKRANLGQKVLFVCFNKTLAAELRRDFAQKVPALGDGSIFATHSYGLLRYLIPDANYAGDSASEYFTQMLNRVKTLQAEDAGSIEQFDVILVDESQDLSEETIQLLKLISRPDASWFVAYGEGQELYEPYKAAPSLLEWLESATKKNQSRNFRSGTHAFFTYQSVFEFDKPEGFDVGKAKKWATERISKNVKSLTATTSDMLDFNIEVDFSSSAGSLIEVLSVEEPRTEDLVRVALEGLKRDMMAVISDSDVNALIVVKGKTAQSYREAVAFLRSNDLTFFDLVQDSNRNEIPTNTAIRVVSSLSARGLSADFVVVFDFDEISERNRRNITYVLLSRAARKTVVAVRRKFLTEHTKNLMEVSDHVRNELRARGY